MPQRDASDTARGRRRTRVRHFRGVRSDEDDELFDKPVPQPTAGGKDAETAQDLKPGNSRPKDSKDGPDADRSDDKKIGVAGSEAPQETAPGPKTGKKSGVRTASAEN